MYSVEVRGDLAGYRRLFPGARISARDFLLAYAKRRKEPSLHFSRAMDALFSEPANEDELEIKALIDAFDMEVGMTRESGYPRHRGRPRTGSRHMPLSPVAGAQRGQGVDACERRAATHHQPPCVLPAQRDRSAFRHFPGWYAPVLIVERGEWVIKPMRYLCRPQGQPTFYDRKFPGIFNARRHNLQSFWKGQFGHTHALMVADACCDNVQRHVLEHRPLRPFERAQDIMLEFRPLPRQPLLMACLYSHWTPPEGSADDELWSFAAVTDAPPPEIAQVGHDRCIVPLRHERAQAWLTPQGRSPEELDLILEERMPCRYEHRMAQTDDSRLQRPDITARPRP